VDAGDLFGEWVPEEWIRQIRGVVKNCYWHTFIYLTKNPARLRNYTFLQNEWVGTTVTGNSDFQRVKNLSKTDARVKFLSIEPLLEPVEFDLSEFQWIIIGAQTGPKAVKPERRWVDIILQGAEKHKIPVFIKNNLRYSLQLRQFPGS